jgi:hypothetical protein
MSRFKTYPSFCFNLFLLVLLVANSLFLQAQEKDTLTVNKLDQIHSDTLFTGSILYKLPSGLFDLIEVYKKANYTSPGFEGYRVQVLSDAGNNAKDRAQTAVVEFERQYPGITVYLSYQQPNFKVRCGDFRTKAEACRLLNEVSGQYPGAYIVRDYIRLP